MRLQFLGTGGAFTDFRENYHNNAIVHVEGGVVLIDCGGTAVQSLKELGISVHDVKGVIITHLHGDHIGGLEQLLWERYYTGPNGPSFSSTKVWTTLGIHLDIRDILTPCVQEITKSDGKVYNDGYKELVDHQTVDPGWSFLAGGIHFSLRKTPHVTSDDGLVDKPSFGVLAIDSEEDSFYYTSDTTFRPNVGELFPDVTTIFHDCVFYPKYPGTVHTHWEELQLLPPEIQDKIVLMHHTKVPAGLDLGRFRAAARHDSFEVIRGQ